jgi:hypothetical protein
MSIFRDFFVKEKPVFTGITRGVGGFGFGSGGGGTAGPSNASGGTIATPGNGYVYHFFTSDTPSPERKLVNNITRDVDYLIIGGGGAGGNAPDTGDYEAAGGGGAGAFLTGTSSSLAAGEFPVTIGAGGAAGSGSFPGNSGDQGNDGADTTWNSLTAPGGGAGGGGTNRSSPDGRVGNNGGSSGGHGGYGPSPNYANPAEADQHPGSGDSFPSPPNGWGGKGHGSYAQCGGGGGGASGVTTRGGTFLRINGHDGFAAFNGDTGVPSDYGTPGPGPGRYFAAGGAGGIDETDGTNSVGSDGRQDGGYGGGGRGGSGGPDSSPVPAPAQALRKGEDATAHTGSGGGGAGRDHYPASALSGHGGAGADGIVILRYTV